MKAIVIDFVKIVIPTVLTTLLLMCFFSFVMLNTNVTGKTMTIFIGIIYLISTFVMGVATGKVVKKRKFLWGMVAGTVYFAIILIISASVGNDDTTGFNPSVAALLCLLGGTLGGMFS